MNRWVLVGVAVLLGLAGAVAVEVLDTPRRRLMAALKKAGIDAARVRVTSEARSSKQQAGALLSKMERHGYTAPDFFKLYSDDEQIAALMPYLEAGDAAGLEAELQRWADRGRPLSAHMRNSAIDFVVTPPLTDAQLRAVAVAAGPGASLIREEDHIHYQEAKTT